VGDFEGGLVVGALEGKVIAGGDPVKDITVLFLQTVKLLDELVLVKVKLELGLDLFVEQSGVVVVRGAPRRHVVEESLEELDLVLVGPKSLEQPAQVGPVRQAGFVDVEESDKEMQRKVKKAQE
jgi:hypothetical protein